MPVTSYYTVNGAIVGENGPNGQIDYQIDALGSVTGTMNSSGSAQRVYRYKPFGALLNDTGPGAEPAFRWVGSKGYRQTSLVHSDYYVRSRHYSAAEGHWTAIDRYWPAEKPYAVVGASVVTRIDPSGDWTINECECKKCDPKKGCVEIPQNGNPNSLGNSIGPACRAIKACSFSPACLKCVGKYTSNPDGVLSCLIKMCTGQNSLVVSCGGIGCWRGDRCGYPGFGFGCSIIICSDTTYSPCSPCFPYWTTCMCNVPACNAEFGLSVSQSIIHEMSHCCGTTDDNEQANNIAAAIWDYYTTGTC